MCVYPVVQPMTNWTQVGYSLSVLNAFSTTSLSKYKLTISLLPIFFVEKIHE